MTGIQRGGGTVPGQAYRCTVPGQACRCTLVHRLHCTVQRARGL